MASALKYIIDDNGQKTSVLVPIKVWQDLKSNYEKLQKKLAVFTSIELGLREVKNARRTGKKLQTLNDFLK
jgi:hypothetical protein